MTVAVLMSALALAAPAAEVATVDGTALSGRVVALDSSQLTLETDGATQPVPLDTVLEVRFPDSEPAAEPASGDIRLYLHDNGELACRQVVMEDRTVVANTVAAGELRFPLSAVVAVRFRPEDPAVGRNWSELVRSGPERDLIIVRNGDVLDRLDGTISALTAETLTFLVGETRVPVDRTKPKLFGVVVGRSPATRKPAVGELKFRNGDRLPVTELALEGESLRAGVGGVKAAFRTADLAAIDFGRGKIQFLSELEPRQIEHTPFFGTSPLDSVFDVHRDRSDAGPETPIRIDRQSYKRGLVIHSRTRLTYRLNGEFQRFVAVAGIEQLVRPRGDLDLVIMGDKKELFRRNVKGTDAPIPLDLDVTSVRDLTIFVDFAGDLDISDHLALGDARLIK